MAASPQGSDEGVPQCVGRVLLVADPAEGGLGRSLARGFEANGWQVVFEPWGAWRPRLLVNPAHRIASLGAPFRRSLRARVAGLGSVDLVLIVKGQFFDAGLITHMRDVLDAPVVCWNPDDPLDDALSNRGAGIPAAVGHYDLYVTWSSEVASRIEPMAGRVSVIPFGWDPEQHFPEPLREGDDSSILERPVFVGSWTADREAWIRALAELRPVVHGDRWPSTPGVQCGGAIYGSSLRRVLANACWSVNLLRPQNRLSHNMRTFEVIGCGGREVAPRSPDHQRWLEANGVPLFETAEELVEIIRAGPVQRLAPSTPDWLAEHTYASRVRDLLGAVGG